MRIVWLVLMCLLAANAVAKNQEDEIKGFVVDQTISRIGHEFYQHFTDRLRDTSPMDFNLVVVERPSARWGSLIWVEFERRMLYRSFLQPNTSQLQETAYQAADFVQEGIARQKLEQLFDDTFDMDKDEI
ncbi:Curli production assembly/transport component CsgE [Pseudomonas marincola]|uniref:Curli production assembly/transport component CsgE n=1 Tax=Pseudomonas marincola TaxID=437900 RepID=A0A653E641_9PSED|nr:MULTISPECIES: curli production assembly/transport protein CsgE [Pseudomonas]NRH26086.1 curli production assembly/transport protein CsgE [Pseudomonas sp. MS19]CAE6890333.1 Curli production assembly/transport component CsgE [Pseudomonas marincola]